MLLEEPNGCALCERVIGGCAGGIPVYFCKQCFDTHSQEILKKVPWIDYLRKAEKNRRRNRNRRRKHGLKVYGQPPVFESLEVLWYGAK